MDTGFLKKSGWTFVVIGAIAFIVGLLIGVSGIWISGGTAVACGVYLFIKAKQAADAVAKQTKAASTSAQK